MGTVVRALERTSEESGGGAGARDSALASRMGVGCSGDGGLRNWGPARALGQRRGDVPVRGRCGSRPATPSSLLQERGRDSLGSFPILTSQEDSGWKQGMGRLGESHRIIFSDGADGNPIWKKGRGFSLSS